MRSTLNFRINLRKNYRRALIYILSFNITVWNNKEMRCADFVKPGQDGRRDEATEYHRMEPSFIIRYKITIILEHGYFLYNIKKNDMILFFLDDWPGLPRRIHIT